MLSVPLLALPLIIAVSLVTYHGVEKPFLQLRMKYLIDTPSPTTGPARTDECERESATAGAVR